MKTSEERTAVLVDRHPLWLDVVSTIVQRAGVEVCAKLASSTLALERIASLNPALLITEIDMAGEAMDGITLIREVQERCPGIRTIVFSMYDDRRHIEAAFDAGADAYLVKTAHSEDLLSAVRQAFQHSIYFAGPRLRPRRPAAVGGVLRSDSSPARSPRLTRREVEILRLVAEGYSNAQLARMLWVTEQTVKFHLSNIYRKLEVANRTEASRWAQLHGLLEGRPVKVAAS